MDLSFWVNFFHTIQYSTIDLLLLKAPFVDGREGPTIWATTAMR
jgi:hypothetical protein